MAVDSPSSRPARPITIETEEAGSMAFPVEHLPTPDARELTAAEGRRLIDERARRFLGMSGEEFTRRWQAGELDEHDDNVLRIALLLPLGR